MKSAPFLLSIVAIPSLAFAVAACGGKEESVAREGSSSTAQTAGQRDPAATGSSKAAPAPECTHSGQSGSGGSGGPGGGYSCLSGHHYDCAGGERSISCECKGQGGTWGPTGTCTCSDTGVTFDFDCSNACSALPAEVFAKCNLPAPLPDPPSSGQGSTSSSSGG